MKFQSDNTPELTAVFYGTYDTGKPRVRLLMSGARAANINVLECHVSVWSGVEDKSTAGKCIVLGRILRLIGAQPVLLWRYFCFPKHDVVVIPYPGWLEVLLLFCAARIRRVPIVWDVFLPLHETIVEDRSLFARKGVMARVLFAFEWATARAATKIILDTHAHARYFEKKYDLMENSVARVLVGAEDIFYQRDRHCFSHSKDAVSILFYGQFIPLHGIDTILECVVILEQRNLNCKWTIVGTGQESQRIDALIAKVSPTSVNRIRWVNYGDLPEYLRRSDISLGIFGTTEKAARVIPNKVFQSLAVGTLCVTADTPAIRELEYIGTRLHLVRPGDPIELADAIEEISKTREFSSLDAFVIGAAEVGSELKHVLEVITANHSRGTHA